MPEIAVPMLAFLRTGEFGPIKLGISRAELQGYLGDPQNWGPYPKAQQHAAVWKYGEIEFYFDNSNALWMIFSDHVETLNGGEAIDLHPWVLSDNLTVKQALSDFEDAGVSCQPSIDWALDDGTERFRVGVGVELIFADPRYDSDPEKELRPLAPADMTFHGFSFYERDTKIGRTTNGDSAA